jgi:hypothetical protein
MFPSGLRFSWTALPVLLIIASPSSAQIVNVAQNLGTTQGTTGILTPVTSGANMGGMQVTAFFTNSTSETVSWVPLGLINGGASGTNWSLMESGDTDISTWFLTNTTGLGITRLVIDGGPGRTIFDRTFGGMVGTPGTSFGRDFVLVSGGLSTDNILAIYHDQVAVVPNAPVGDIFRSLDINFLNSGGFASGRALPLGFGADTDTTVDVLFPLAIPEPGSLLLFGVAALGVVGHRRLLPRRAA